MTGQTNPGGATPKLPPGDAAYILAWCAWRGAASQCYEDWTDHEDEVRRRFVQWWNDSGELLLADWGYRVLDAEGREVVIDA